MDKYKSKFVVLDRDGVINEDLFDYVLKPEQFEFIGGSLQALINLTSSGYEIVVVTNQACIGAGLVSPESIVKVNEYMKKEVEENGGRIKGVFMCPHKQGGSCNCRKPKPGLLLKAEKELGISLEGAYFVGDKLSDMEAAISFGCKPVLVKTGYGLNTLSAPGLPENLECFKDLAEFVRNFLSK